MGRLLALVVDRDVEFRANLQDRLGVQGIEALGAVSTIEAKAVAGGRRVDLLLAVPGEIIADSANWPQPPVAVAVFGTSDELLESGATWLERGAADLLALDAGDQTIELALKRAAAWAEQRGRHAVLRNDRRESEGFGGLVGRSAALESIRERLNRLAPLGESVWIEGEEGVGKKWCARALHHLAADPADPFVVLEAQDLEAPGWEDRWLAASSDGVAPRLTLYLAEPASFNLDGIAMLQRLMLRLGETNQPGFRIVSGSTLPWKEAVERAQLPQPLAGQLASSSLFVPALRERPEDIGPMALHFIRSIEQVNQLNPLLLSAAALDQLEAYEWPGNVRELRHAIEHAAILADGLIDLPHLPKGVRDNGGTSVVGSNRELAAKPFREAKGGVVAEFEEAYLRSLMERERGNVTAAAREAGMLRSALQRLLRKYGLKSSDFRRRTPAKTSPTRREPRPD